MYCKHTTFKRDKSDQCKKITSILQICSSNIKATYTPSSTHALYVRFKPRLFKYISQHINSDSQYLSKCFRSKSYSGLGLINHILLVRMIKPTLLHRPLHTCFSCTLAIQYML